MRNTIAEKKTYLDFVDGLRGTAILMVIAVHTYQQFSNSYREKFTIEQLENFIKAGQRGVQLFFMLSAFVLFNSLNLRFQEDKYPKLTFYWIPWLCFRCIF